MHDSLFAAMMPGGSRIPPLSEFMAMWSMMTLVMMTPSAIPMLLPVPRRSHSRCCVIIAYFGIWLLAGTGIYLIEGYWERMMALSTWLGRYLPLLKGIGIIAAGVFQCTRLKVSYLAQCRCPDSCTGAFNRYASGLRLGCEKGMVCCISCAPHMTVQLLVGMMNPVVMIATTAAITAEKLLPRPVIVARTMGFATITIGLTLVLHANPITTGNHNLPVDCGNFLPLKESHEASHDPGS